MTRQSLLSTREIYQAAMEVHSRISTTEITVINTLKNTDSQKEPPKVMPVTKLSQPTKVSDVGGIKVSVLTEEFSLKELNTTVTMGIT